MTQFQKSWVMRHGLVRPLSEITQNNGYYVVVHCHSRSTISVPMYKWLILAVILYFTVSKLYQIILQILDEKLSSSVIKTLAPWCDSADYETTGVIDMVGARPWARLEAQRLSSARWLTTPKILGTGWSFPCEISAQRERPPPSERTIRPIRAHSRVQRNHRTTHLQDWHTL